MVKLRLRIVKPKDQRGWEFPYVVMKTRTGHFKTAVLEQLVDDERWEQVETVREDEL